MLIIDFEGPGAKGSLIGKDQKKPLLEKMAKAPKTEFSRRGLYISTLYIYIGK